MRIRKNIIINYFFLIVILLLIIFICIRLTIVNNKNKNENITNDELNHLEPIKTIDMTKSFEFKRPDNGELLTLSYSNSSIIEDPLNPNKYILNSRCLTLLPSLLPYYLSINKLTRLDHNFEIIESKLIDDNINQNSFAIGIEDIRLYVDNGEIYYSGSYFNGIVMKISNNKYIIEKEKLNLVPNLIHVEFNNYDNLTEKNWSYFDYKYEKHVIYQWFPLKICKIIDNKLVLFESHIMPEYFSDFRGSSCGITYKDNIWFIIHTKTGNGFIHHHFVCFDENMNLIKYSKPYYFESDNVEYCTSFVINHNNIIIPYTVNDFALKIGIYKLDYIFNELEYIDHKND